MERDTDTILKIRIEAFREFMEKGYTNASLRSICKEAGVTTGALYFFFKDKDELFTSLVKEMVEEIYVMMMQHYSLECEMEDSGFQAALEGELEDTEDEKVIRNVIHVLYQNREKALLLLTKAQGSSMEGVVDRFAQASEVQYRNMAARMEKLYPGREVSPYVPNWFAHDQIEGIVYAITHIDREEEALVFVGNLAAYLRGGWKAIWAEAGDKGSSP